MALPCPICNAKAYIRTSRPMSELTREQYYHCTNAKCEHVFVAMISIVRTVGGSLLPPDKQSGWPHEHKVPVSPSRGYASQIDKRQLYIEGVEPPEAASG